MVRNHLSVVQRPHHLLFVLAVLLAAAFVFSQLNWATKERFHQECLRTAISYLLWPSRSCLALVFLPLFTNYYLAIYFQSVKGPSATHAGIQLLPLLIATVLSSIVTSDLISAVGYYTPVMLFCMILYAIGAGLIITWNLTTPTKQWFGYQVLAGLGIGVGFQGGILVVQTVHGLHLILPAAWWRTINRRLSVFVPNRHPPRHREECAPA